jgi:membrane complex biogenesis BtpA family protein
MPEIIDAAVKDAVAYKDGGIDALMVENMHDAPYLLGRVEPETTAAMAVVAQAVKEETGLPTGVQILAGANSEALAVAVAADLEFIRVEGFVFAHVGDEGLHESCAAALLRRRSALGSQQVKVLADIKKKHSSHAITSDVDLADTAKACEFFGADGVIVTGKATASPAELTDVKTARAATTGLVLVGSGVTPENANQFVPFCDGLIVGSSCKYEGYWRNHVEPERVASLMESIAVHR